MSPGVHVFAACCKATATLNCRVEVSAETGLTAGKSKWVACPDGYVMTGCNVFAESGRSAGAKIEGQLSPLLQSALDINVSERLRTNPIVLKKIYF